jgi:hypothetical protein
LQYRDGVRLLCLENLPAWMTADLAPIPVPATLRTTDPIIAALREADSPPAIKAAALRNRALRVAAHSPNKRRLLAARAKDSNATVARAFLQARLRAQPSGHRPRTQARTAFTGEGGRVDRGLLRRWGRYAPAIARWERITGRAAPAPAILNEAAGPRPAPIFVEWLMGLPESWVTSSAVGLTHSQQLTALGNGVVPDQAARAL